MRWRKPDNAVDHFPQGSCGCGLDLAGAADLGVARSYQQEDVPDAAWPQQGIRSLRGLIHTCHAARGQGLPAIPASDRKPLETEFRRAVTVGLAAVSRSPARGTR